MLWSKMTIYWQFIVEKRSFRVYVETEDVFIG